MASLETLGEATELAAGSGGGHGAPERAAAERP
jgi:hypothetical protein